MAQSNGYIPIDPETDPRHWLEDITGERALEWVRERNAQTDQALGNSEAFSTLKSRLLAILDLDERIAYVAKHDPYYYNFWRDRAHVRGIWRRTTPEEYAKSEPSWEVVLDLDKLAATEGNSWQWGGEVWLEPEQTRCLIRLSRGGSDAIVVREFDIGQKAFVSDGFTLGEAKSKVAWLDWRRRLRSAAA